MPSLGEPKSISENRPWKVLSNDSVSMYLKPDCSTFSSSGFCVRAMWAMLLHRCMGKIT